MKDFYAGIRKSDNLKFEEVNLIKDLNFECIDSLLFVKNINLQKYGNIHAEKICIDLIANSVYTLSKEVSNNVQDIIFSYRESNAIEVGYFIQNFLKEGEQNLAIINLKILSRIFSKCNRG